MLHQCKGVELFVCLAQGVGCRILTAYAPGMLTQVLPLLV